MADTYTQLYIHIIFAVKGRESLIPKHHKEALHQYITRIITHKKQAVIRINSMPDHLHILVGITPDIAVSDLVRDIKANSSKWINKKGGFLADLSGRRVLQRLLTRILSWMLSSVILKIRRHIIPVGPSERNILIF